MLLCSQILWVRFLTTKWRQLASAVYCQASAGRLEGRGLDHQRAHSLAYYAVNTGCWLESSSSIVLLILISPQKTLFDFITIWWQSSMTSILRDRTTCGHMSLLCPCFASHIASLLSSFTCGRVVKLLPKFKVRKQRHCLLGGGKAKFWRACQTRNTTIAIFGKYSLSQGPKELIGQILLPPLALSYIFCNYCGFLNEGRGRGLTRTLDSA